MSDISLSRRATLGGSAASILALATGATLGSVTRVMGQTTLRRRVDINDPVAGPAVTADYRAAVEALKARGSSHPAGWAAFAAVHTNFCPHGNWYFLPWHRAYLLALERACADAIGKPDFALPYWNWATFRQLPAGFVDATVGGKANALFHDRRVMKKNDTLTQMVAPFGLDAEAIFGSANIQKILAAKSFQAFGSFKPSTQNSSDTSWQRRAGTKTALESEPHDYGHGAVGGDMGGQTTSPNDPIFYLHHANLDRIWAHWNGAGNANESSPFWRDLVFRANFPKPDGSPGEDIVVSSLNDSRALGYEYDDQPAPPAAIAAASFNLKAFSSLSLPDAVELGKASSLAFPRTGPLDDTVRQIVETSSAKAPTSERLFVRLNGVTTPEDTRTNVRVFLNCDYLTAMTPVDDPHYAGSFTFFVAKDDGSHKAGTGHGAHGDGQSFAIDVTDTVKKLQALGLDPAAELQVQLMPVSFGGKAAPSDAFQIGSIEFATI